MSFSLIIKRGLNVLPVLLLLSSGYEQGQSTMENYLKVLFIVSLVSTGLVSAIHHKSHKTKDVYEYGLPCDSNSLSCPSGQEGNLMTEEAALGIPLGDDLLPHRVPIPVENEPEPLSPSPSPHHSNRSPPKPSYATKKKSTKPAPVISKNNELEYIHVPKPPKKESIKKVAQNKEPDLKHETKSPKKKLKTSTSRRSPQPEHKSRATAIPAPRSPTPRIRNNQPKPKPKPTQAKKSVPPVVNVSVHPSPKKKSSTTTSPPTQVSRPPAGHSRPKPTSTSRAKKHEGPPLKKPAMSPSKTTTFDKGATKKKYESTKEKNPKHIRGNLVI